METVAIPNVGSLARLRWTTTLMQGQCNGEQRSTEGAAATLCSAPQSNRDFGQWVKDCPYGVDDGPNCRPWSKPAELPSAERDSLVGFQRRISGSGSGRDGIGHRGRPIIGQATRSEGERAGHAIASDCIHFQRSETARQPDGDEIEVGVRNPWLRYSGITRFGMRMLTPNRSSRRNWKLTWSAVLILPGALQPTARFPRLRFPALGSTLPRRWERTRTAAKCRFRERRTSRQSHRRCLSRRRCHQSNYRSWRTNRNQQSGRSMRTSSLPPPLHSCPSRLPRWVRQTTASMSPDMWTTLDHPRAPDTRAINLYIAPAPSRIMSRPQNTDMDLPIWGLIIIPAKWRRPRSAVSPARLLRLRRHGTTTRLQLLGRPLLESPAQLSRTRIARAVHIRSLTSTRAAVRHRPRRSRIRPRRHRRRRLSSAVRIGAHSTR